MFWVIHHRNGVALAEAANRDSALEWCEAQLGNALGPFALTPAIETDLEDFGMTMHIGQEDLDIARSICEATEELSQPELKFASVGTLH
jgi:hypothetical protein